MPITTLTSPQWNGSLERAKRKSCLSLRLQSPSGDGFRVNGRSRRCVLHLLSVYVGQTFNACVLQVMKIVRAIRQGRILPNKPKTASTQPQFYAIWNDEPSNAPAPLPAPKPRLPGHAESYNPPEEYLPTQEEREKWEATDPEDRERDFLPQKYPALRLVPAYDQFIKERFSRQLDLYLAPRVQRVKLQIDPESLIPKLPSPSSLRPFPVYRSLQVAHDGRRVRTVSVSPDGGWVVTGDEGGVVRLWEVIVGKEVKRWTFKSKVGAVEWCPRTDVSFFAVAVYVSRCVSAGCTRTEGLFAARTTYTSSSRQTFLPPCLPQRSRRFHPLTSHQPPPSLRRSSGYPYPPPSPRPTPPSSRSISLHHRNRRSSSCGIARATTSLQCVRVQRPVLT